MSSYTPQFFGADPIVAQAAVDSARAQVIAAGQAVKGAKTPEQRAAAEQARVQANDNLVLAQNNLRLAKDPQAASTVIDSSKGTTVSDIQKFFSQQPASQPPIDSLQQAIQQQQAAELTQVPIGGPKPQVTGPKIPWILIAGIALFAIKIFVLKKVTQSSKAAEGV